MDHEEIKELLSAFSNDELGTTQQGFVEEHLKTCAECAETLSDFNMTRIQLTSLRAMPVPASVKEIIMTELPEPVRSNKRLVALRPVFASLVILLALAAPFALILSSGSGSAVAQAAEATEGLTSYRVEGSTTQTFAGQTYETTFAWDFADATHYKGTLATANAPNAFVVDGDTQYNQGVPPGTQINITEGGIFSPVPTREGTLALLDSLIDEQELDDEETGDGYLLRRAGSVDIDAALDAHLAALDPNDPVYASTVAFVDTQRSITIDLDLWIDPDSFFIQRMVIAMTAPVTSQNGDGSTSTSTSTIATDARYSRFNESITVAPPLDAAGDLLPGWQVSGTSGGPDPIMELQLVGE
jgi:hypothetical protein